MTPPKDNLFINMLNEKSSKEVALEINLLI